MAFPTTGVLDDFNRANEGPPPSASWTDTWLTGSGLTVNTNQCATNGGTTLKDSYWNVSTFGPDAEAFVTIATIPTTDGDSIRLGIRLAQPGATTVDGYLAMWQWIAGAGADRVRLFRLDNGAATELGTGVDLNMSAGDKLGMETIGSTIKVYTKSGAGAWTERRSETDATYSAAGFIGLQFIRTVFRCDDFGGGTVAGAAPPQRTLLGVGT